MEPSRLNGNLEVVDGPPQPADATGPDSARWFIWYRSPLATERKFGRASWTCLIGPCTIQLRARDGDGEVICSAQESFTIVTDTTTKVNLVLVCDVSFQAPVGMLDVDATFKFTIGNFCPGLHVINCVNDWDPVNTVEIPLALGGECSAASDDPGAQCAVDTQCPNGTCDPVFVAAAGCQVRASDVDGNCGTSCDPQACFVHPPGIICSQPGGGDIQDPSAPPGTCPGTPATGCIYDAPPMPALETIVTCTSSVTPINPAIPVCSVDCEVDGQPNFVCSASSDNDGDACPGSDLACNAASDNTGVPCASDLSCSAAAFNAGSPCAVDAECPGGACNVVNCPNGACDADTCPGGSCLAGCTFSGNVIGTTEQQLPSPGNPGDGGFVVAYTLCSQNIITQTRGFLPQCSVPSQIGNPIYSGADCTCVANTNDGDDDCQKFKDVSLTGPGDSPCVLAGCVTDQPCPTFCNAGNECDSTVCDDSTGSAVCNYDPLPSTTSCDEWLPANGLCDGAGSCIIQGCNGDGDCNPPDDANCLGQQPCDTTSLTCGAQPPGNDGGPCDSGVGSGDGTCNNGTTPGSESCETNDTCFVDADCGTNPNVCIANVCNQSGSPWACDIDLNANDNDNCTIGSPPVAGICDTGVCVLPPILDTFQGCTTTSYNCFIQGTVSLTLDIFAQLCIDSPGDGLVDVAYDLRAEEVGTFLLAGVAADTAIIVAANIPILECNAASTNTGTVCKVNADCPGGACEGIVASCTPVPAPPDAGCRFVGPTEVVTTVANGSATGPLAPSGIRTPLDLGIPPLNLNNILKVGNSQDPDIPYLQIVLSNAVFLVPPIPNVCDGTNGCAAGNIPPGWQPVVEGVLPDAAGTDVLFNVGGVNMVIAAVGGALILPVSTADATICDPSLTQQGPDLAVPALSQGGPLASSTCPCWDGSPGSAGSSIVDVWQTYGPNDCADPTFGDRCQEILFSNGDTLSRGQCRSGSGADYLETQVRDDALGGGPRCFINKIADGGFVEITGLTPTQYQACLQGHDQDITLGVSQPVTPNIDETLTCGLAAF